MRQNIISSLLLAVLGNTHFLAFAQTTIQITYQPAIGYYLCDQGLVCTLSGCDGDCSTIANDFSVSNVDGKTVYTSTAAQASLSVDGGSNSSIICDASCSCQDLLGNGDGCHVPAVQEPNTDDHNGENFIRSIKDNSSSRMMSAGVSISLAAAAMAFWS